MNEISIKSLNNLTNLNLIDIRANYLYLRGTISSAVNIPYQALKSYPNTYLKRNLTYYLFCENGIESKRLSTYLNALGFNTYSIKEGYLEIKNNNC
ncbi:rhodanese-like domain-containing protein [bacterium]|nr:rhodanese-like domain-containing protein [bacterium]